jgi:hypothetical protein
MKLHNSDNYEPIKVFFTSDSHPILHGNLVRDLVNSGLPVAAAFKEVDLIGKKGMELEIYCEPGHGVFAVEPGAVEAGTIYSPYTGELCDEAEDI